MPLLIGIVPFESADFGTGWTVWFESLNDNYFPSKRKPKCLSQIVLTFRSGYGFIFSGESCERNYPEDYRWEVADGLSKMQGYWILICYFK